jgi:hypothetical protein
MNEPAAVRPKICYIGGWGRSGSTILGKILGQFDGFVDVGETKYLWGVLRNPQWRCGCGELMTACPFWSAVVSTSTAANGPMDLASTDVLAHSSERFRRIGALWRNSRRVSRSQPAIERHLGGLYASIAEVSGARVIVDTSKTPSWSLIASGVEDVEVYVVHLVRDPRAVAFSWSRVRPSPGGIAGENQETCSTSRSALHWVGNNVGLATASRHVVGASRYLRVRYEDFVSSPEETVLEIVEFLGEQPIGNPFTSAARAELQPTHNASGNPSRFKSGEIELVPDEEWRTLLPSGARNVTLAIAGVAMPSMGYRPRLK